MVAAATSAWEWEWDCRYRHQHGNRNREIGVLASIPLLLRYQATSNGGETFAAPPVVEKKEEEEFEKVEPRGRANTLPSVESEETEDGVILRVPSGIRHNPDKRKSGNFFIISVFYMYSAPGQKSKFFIFT